MSIYYRTHNTFLDFALASMTGSVNDCTPISDISTEVSGSRMRRSSSDAILARLPDTDDENIQQIRCRSDSGWSTIIPFVQTPQGSPILVSNGYPVIDLTSAPETVQRKEPNHKIFVGGLSPITDDLVLFQFMSQFGPVKNVTVKRNPITGQSRRYAFVKFYQPPDPSVFQHTWSVDDNIIRISKYQVSSAWKNHYYSDDEL
jgi:hypothetical protein